jgi:tetratricopeptide (TPR) repeat protein
MLHALPTSSIFSFIRRFAAGASLLALVTTGGCAGAVQRWIVNTRVHQGEVAIQRGNVRDAEVSFQLALKVDPSDERARSGFVSASADLAQEMYTKGDFEDALATIAAGLKYDPSSVRLAALKASIDDAKLKREIVLSNYPTYRAAGAQIVAAYKQLDVTNKEIVKNLSRFAYTYDTDDLTTAIKRSYDLELDVARNTNRLILYRQVVSSGVPEAPHAATSANAASLLPLP